MNTFIPYGSLSECCKILDNKRLGKQRVECMQLLNSYTKEQKGWKNHPITIMWKEYPLSLKYYTNCMITEWIARGFKNTMQLYEDYDTNMPWWFSWKQLNFSHQSALLNKDFDYYSKFFDVDVLISNHHIKYGYIWVNKLTEEQIYKAKNNIWIEPSEICWPLQVIKK